MQKIGIVCAGDEELAPFLPHMEHIATTEKAMLKFYQGTIYDVSVVILYCGAGKVNAAIASQILIDDFSVDGIISAGTAGGMDTGINLFDTVISTQVAYHDVADGTLTEFHPWMQTIYFDADETFLEIASAISRDDRTVHLGRMVTGEKFIKHNRREEINKKYAPLSVDMESASIAHVCYANKVPFISIRSITDTAEHVGIETFEENCMRASAVAKNMVLTVLAELNC